MDNRFLVRPFISVWTARKMDKQATREAKERANATAKAGVKVYKTVLAAKELDKVHTIANAARMEHRKRTVPWTYEGVGAITSEGYPAYKDAMTRCQTEFRLAVDRFMRVYDKERVEAQEYLGTMFNPMDYPTTSALRLKFAFALHAEPIAQAQHFQPTELPAEVVSEIRREIVASTSTALQNANASAWSRVIDRVQKLRDGLQAYKPGNGNGEKTTGKFHDTLVGNIKELADLLPSINVANDPDLKRMGQKLKMLAVYAPQDLRDSDALRRQVTQEAEAVLASIDAAYKKTEEEAA